MHIAVWNERPVACNLGMGSFRGQRIGPLHRQLFSRNGAYRKEEAVTVSRTCCMIWAITTLAPLAVAQERLQTACELAQACPRVAGAPAYSDVCFSPRWPRQRPGGDPLAMAKRFHATRLEWVYLGDASEFCQQAAAIGASVCGAVNSNLPDSPQGPSTYRVGRARNLDGQRVLPGFMAAWGCYWGCANNPDFRQIWLEHAEQQLRAGADRIQNDGPRLSEGGMLHWGGCYCEHCVSGFRQYLIKTLPRERLAAFGLDPVDEFDYAAYLRGNRDATPGTDQARQQATDLLAMFQDFQQASVLAFYRDVHGQLEKRIGRRVPFSCNNAEGFLLYLHRVHDFAMFEAYPDKEGIPEFFYRERVLPFRRIGKRFITTFVSEDIQHTRRMIAQSYAFGTHTIAPWDVFTGSKSPRVFGDPADSADLFGFVRANPALFDGYEEAAVTGAGLEDAGPTNCPPVRVRGGTRQVVAVVRAVPGKPRAPVVVHLIDWSPRPEPFSIVLDPRRSFGDCPLRVRLVAPAPYDAAVHAEAAESGNYRQLTLSRACAAGRQTQVDVPALNPWGMLIVERGTDLEGTDLWSPMIWAEPDSYYAKQLRIRLECPSPNVSLRFTLDGSEPRLSSPRYEAAFVLSETTHVRARVFDKNGQLGPQAQAEFRRLAGPTVTMLQPDSPTLRKNLRLWLSADSLADSHADGDLVSRWTSRAGPAPQVSDVQLLNGQAASPPLFRSDGINGRPVVEFSEPSHHLDIPRFSGEYLDGKPFAIFMVARSTDLQFGFGGNAINGSGGIPRLYVTRGSLHFDVLRGIPTGASAGKATINTYVYDGGRLRTWVDGKPRGWREQPEPVATLGGAGHFAIPFWGASEFHGGEMAEIVVFDRHLAEAERIGVETYLAEKYAISDRPRWR